MEIVNTLNSHVISFFAFTAYAACCFALGYFILKLIKIIWRELNA